MKKIGFTLAEVLITLGIIGVVAALTAPALVQNAGSAQTGPKLAKAVSTFELACENLLNDEGANGIHSVVSGTEVIGYSRSFVEKLQNYMKLSIIGSPQSGELNEDYVKSVSLYDGSTVSNGSWGLVFAYTLAGGTQFLTKDGFLCTLLIAPTNSQLPAHRRQYGVLCVDINGTATPNRLGKDVFFFAMYDDGSLRPAGGSNWYDDGGSLTDVYWKDGNDKCNETTVTSGFSCAGSIFENNLKVIYQ